MKKIYILSTIWMAFIVGACDYNDKNFDGLDDIVKPANVVKEKYTLVEAIMRLSVTIVRIRVSLKKKVPIRR